MISFLRATLVALAISALSRLLFGTDGVFGVATVALWQAYKAQERPAPAGEETRDA